MEYKVGVISGDGIGPEIVTEAKKVLDKIADKYGHSFNYTDILMGVAAQLMLQVFLLQMRLLRLHLIQMRC